MMEDDPADLLIDPATARQELRDALPYLNDRGLYQSAKWYFKTSSTISS